MAFIDYISFKAENSNSQLCVTGRAFNQIFEGMIIDVSDQQKRFMKLATVFARTKPNDKAKIVMAFQHMDLKVSMCGDGANDCGALKQADIGLSLSQAEASISAPFTSQVANISSMVELIKECRCGLATNFTLFNVMAIYSLIQYTTTVICLKYLQYPGDFHYLYWDLVLNFGYIIFIGNTATSKELSVDRPRSSLFCFTNLFQMVFAFAVQVAGQISWIAIYEKTNYDHYWKVGGMDNAKIIYDTEEGFATGGIEASILYVLTNNFYTITMIAFNIAKPWREYFFTNIPLLIAIIISLTYNHIIIFWREGTWVELFIDTETYALFPDFKTRWITFGVSWGFGLFIYFNQKLILEPVSAWLIRKYP